MLNAGTRRRWRAAGSSGGGGDVVADGTPALFMVSDNSASETEFSGVTAGGEFNASVDAQTLRVYFEGIWKATYFDGGEIAENYEFPAGSAATLPQFGVTTEWTFVGGTNASGIDNFKWYSMFS